MTAQPSGTPPALAHNVRHNKVLHEHVVLLTAEPNRYRSCPTIDAFLSSSSRMESFMRPRCMASWKIGLPEVLHRVREKGVRLDLDEITYFLGKETLIVTAERGMAVWREKLFVVMARNAVRATAFFRLPPDRVVELGVQVEL